MNHEPTTSDPMRMTPEEMDRYTTKAPMNADVEAMAIYLETVVAHNPYYDHAATMMEKAAAMLRQLADENAHLQEQLRVARELT